MKLFETNKQFVLIEDGIINNNNYQEYNIVFTNDMNSIHKEEFPDFELIIVTGGSYGFNSWDKICFRGLEFKPKYNIKREDFYLKFLNDLKNGNYETKIEKLAKESISEEDWKIVNCIFKNKNPKIKLLEKKLSEISKINEDLQNVSNKLEKQILENNLLKEKLEKIKELVN